MKPRLPKACGKGSGFTWARKVDGGVVTKACSGSCGLVLPASAFYERRSSGCGLSSWCKECERARMRVNAKRRYELARQARGALSVEASLTPSDVALLADRLALESVPVPEAGCFLWPFGWTKKGYARVAIGGVRLIPAHRAAWIVNRGAIPDGLMVCHRCDTPQCVNPSHLFLGTALDNSQDMVRKGRQGFTIGEDKPTAKLTEEQVRQIRALNLTGLGYRRLARRFEVTRATVRTICKRTTWKHVEDVPDAV